jgi:LysM repeat protein
MSRALAAALLVALAGAAAPVAAPTCAEYRVVRGDTLSRIARRCHSSVAAIARASGIRNPNLILVGQRLVIPGQTRALARDDGKPSPRAEAPADAPRVYHMARGDTLYSLARWSRTGLPALLAANPGIDPRKIEIGDAVRLPAGAVRPERARTRERGAAAAPPPPRAQEPPATQEPERPVRERVREPDVEAM